MSLFKPFHSVILLVIMSCSLFVNIAEAAHVLILGDSKLKPVSDVIKGIEETLNHKTVIKSPSDIKGSLNEVVKKEGAKAVIALGKDAVSTAQTLPPSIPVVYGLVIRPVTPQRPNITGVYMETPLSKYIVFIKRHFPHIKSIGIVCSHDDQKIPDSIKGLLTIKICTAKTPYEFIKGLSSMGKDIDAFVLLPERRLITSKVLQEVYLYSFRENIPIIGISEKYVKTGSLFSLGFQINELGKQIGSVANKVISQGSTRGIIPSPPDSFSLYINKKTAEKMNIYIPKEVLSDATRIYE